jgi:predicted RNA polymerase sigma factor
VTYALAALMCLRAARLPARVDASGNLISLFDQDRSQWDQELIVEGLKFLELSAAGFELTQYHLEAAIASIHACARRTEDTDWEAVVSLYGTLMKIRPSPIVALNRAIAVAQNEGPERGLEEIRSITDCDRLAAYPFYSAALGELEVAAGGTRPRASTSERRSHWRATRWSAGSSIAALARANEAIRSGHTTNKFGKLILRPKTQAEEL